MNLIRFSMSLFLALSLVLFTACDQGGSEHAHDHDHDHDEHAELPKKGKIKPLPDGIVSTAEPTGAKKVDELKKTAKEGDEVIMQVVIGGQPNPFVEGRAMMTVVDQSVPNKCESEDDHCDTPWDYCCTEEKLLLSNKATIQLLDETGKLLALDLGQTQLNPADRITIKGKVGPRPDENILLVSASEIFIKQK